MRRRERLRAGQKLDERRFSRAVYSHQRDAVAPLDDEIRAAEDVLRSVAFRDILELRHDSSARLGLRKREVNRLFVRRHFDALNLFEFLDPALHLLGLGGLRAEAVDKRFELLNALALIADTPLPVAPSARPSDQIFLVVAGIELNLLIPDLDGAD